MTPEEQERERAIERRAALIRQWLRPIDPEAPLPLHVEQWAEQVRQRRLDEVIERPRPVEPGEPLACVVPRTRYVLIDEIDRYPAVPLCPEHVARVQAEMRAAMARHAESVARAMGLEPSELRCDLDAANYLRAAGEWSTSRADYMAEGLAAERAAAAAQFGSARASAPAGDADRHAPSWARPLEPGKPQPRQHAQAGVAEKRTGLRKAVLHNEW